MRSDRVAAFVAVGCGLALLTASAAAARQGGGARQAPAGAPNVAALIAHADNIQPGLSLRPGAFAQLRNPYEGDQARVAQGSKLFIAYNCVDCHGADGSGAMGPSLADGRWHFGGSAGEVVQSIYEGRPDGMPAWGGRIDDQQIWTLVSYVRTLGGGKDVSTENFTGKTVERAGH